MTSNQPLETALTQILSKDKASIIENELKSLILSNMSSESALQYILAELAKDARKLYLIDIFIQSFTSENSPYDYLSIILTIVQSSINQQSLSDIINVFAKIIQKIVSKDVTSANIEYIEMLISFCVYNMKEKEAIKQRAGTLCLGQLINFIPLPVTMSKSIWKNIVDFMDTKAFIAKNELLTILDLLIEKIKGQFSPYATVTLYKTLDFLTESDWVRRKLALKVIYDLVVYCSDDIFQLKQQIIDFLDVVKNDQVEEVALRCNDILDIITAQPNDNKRLISFDDQIKEGKSTAFGKESMLSNEVLMIDENQTERRSNYENNNTSQKQGLTSSPLKVSDLNKDTEESRPLQIQKHLDSNNEPIKLNDRKVKKQEMTINTNTQMPERPKRYIKKQFQDKESVFMGNAYNNTSNTNSNLNANISNSNDSNDKMQLDEKNKSQNENRITDLLKQMKQMSDKQIYLLDVISSLQKSSQEQFNALNSRIMSLELVLSTMIDLPENKGGKSNNNNKKIAQDHNDILPDIISSASDKELINYIVSLSPNELEHIHLTIMEDIVIRFTIMLSKGVYIQQIISVLKYVLIKKNNKFRKITYKNLSDMLVFLSKSKNVIISDEDLIDISLINTLLNKQTNN